MIENDDKTFEIISEEEIDRYINSMTRNEMIIPFSVLEDYCRYLSLWDADIMI